MKLCRLHIEGFKSFIEPVTLDFPTEAGLYHVVGLNLVDERLGSNGAGKSTMFEAWYWALYGKTPGGMKGSHICAWDTVSTEVEVEWEAHGQQYAVRRRRGAKRRPELALREGDQEYRIVDDAKVVDVVGLTDKEFEASVLLDQREPHFFDGTPAKKLELLSQVLGLESWEAASKQAGKEAEEYQKTMTNSDQTIRVLSERVSQYREHLKECESERHNLAQDIRQSRLSRQDQLQEAQDQVKRASQAVTEKELALKLARLNVESAIGAVEDLSQVLKDANAVLDDARNEADDQDIVCRSLERAIALLKQTHQACLVCDSRMTKDVANRIRERKQQELDEATLKLETLVEETAKRHQVVKATARELESAQNHLQSEKTTVDKLTSRLQDAKEWLQNVTKTAKKMETYDQEVSESEKIRKNELEERETRFLVKCAEAQASRKEHEERRQEASQSYELASYWQKAFKDIRLFVLDETIMALEVSVNNALPTLGLPHWSVSFVTERESKSGGLLKGFHVFVQSPTSPEEVPWEAWSGGEGQRLRLAGRLGVSEFIFQAKNVYPTMEVWDEPTAHLSDVGIADLVEALSLRAVEAQRLIWLVDHRAYDLPTDGKVMITKDGRGSRVTEWLS